MYSGYWLFFPGLAIKNKSLLRLCRKDFFFLPPSFPTLPFESLYRSTLLIL